MKTKLIYLMIIAIMLIVSTSILLTKEEYKRSRYAEEIYARANHYFWLPCPICGEYFGGQESDPDAILMETETSATGVCRNCKFKAYEINKEKFGDKAWPIYSTNKKD
jgi:surface polysaccharide O-acyltransferase-like enzyme